MSSGTRDCRLTAAQISGTRLSLPVAQLSSCVPLFAPQLRIVCNLYPRHPSTPVKQRLQASALNRFGLLPVRSPLLGESLLISSPPVTKMFQFTGFRPSCPMCSGMGDRGSPLPGSPIRTSTDLRSLAATRGFSQLATSFFASWRLGIHRTPLLS